MLYPVSFVQLHNMIHMQGTNLGDKINFAQRKATGFLDLEFQTIWVYFNGKLAGVPLTSVASYDLTQTPDHVAAALGIDNTQPSVSTGPAFAKKKIEYVPEEFDPNDDAAAHRARVRAASANSNRPDAHIQQNDALIQESRMAAMGLKTHKTAQVQTAQQVGEAASVVGKKKAISHAQLKVQVAQEIKDPNA